MKRLIAVILLVVLLLCGCSHEVKIDEASIVTRTGTVTDRAMAKPSGRTEFWYESYPYVSIEFEDGSGLCVWNMNEIDVSSKIGIGSVVEVTYGLQANSDFWILIDIKEVE